MSPEIESSIAKIDRIYTDAIEKLSEDRENLGKWRENYGLTLEEIFFLESIQRNDFSALTGRMVSNIKKNIEVSNEN